MEALKEIIRVYESSTSINIALLIARTAIAVLMLTHGLPKMEKMFSTAIVQFPATFGLSAKASLSLAAITEVFCSLFILAGFGTRLAVIPLIFTMLVAVFYALKAEPFAKKELAVMYLVPYVILLFCGSGKYSIDFLLN